MKIETHLSLFFLDHEFLAYQLTIFKLWLLFNFSQSPFVSIHLWPVYHTTIWGSEDFYLIFL